MTERIRIETDLIQQIVSKLDVSWETAFDIAIDQLKVAKDDLLKTSDGQKDWNSGHLYSAWVYCQGQWDDGSVHTWHSRRHDADYPTEATREAWRDFEAHANWIAEATHDGYEYVIHNW